MFFSPEYRKRAPRLQMPQYHFSPELLALVSLAENLEPPSAPLPEYLVRAARLEEIFEETVVSLNLPGLAAPLPGRPLPRSIGRFRFVPIQGGYKLGPMHNMTAAGYGCTVPEGIQMTYTNNGYTGNHGKPYIDTRNAIGLVYDDWLVAVAGAGVEEDGNLKIIQIQDVTSCRAPLDRSDRQAMRERYKTGLYDGLDWAATLIRAWGEVATNCGCPQLVVRSGRNDSHPQVNEIGTHPAYDDAAQRLSLVPLANGDWLQQLPTAQQPN